MQTRETILVATANQGKVAEIRHIFHHTNFDLKFLSDFSEQFKGITIHENAKSFEGNALIKAIVVGDLLNMITLADDSGLCVDALEGRPGIYSARYSKEGTDEANYSKVLKEMENVPFEKRDCHYNCTVAIYDPTTKFVDTVSGAWNGKVALAPRGDKSFGYAPIFLSENSNYQKTNAEFDPEDLIAINHRGQAFKKAIGVLSEYLK
jgi:XTP/dITP diphosphohydrolase